MPEPRANLAATLKERRRARRFSLRDLADETGVSFNTLSRVERGQLPDLKNLQRIADWLEMPTDAFLSGTPSTLRTIARHLRADERLSEQAAEQISKLVEDMYQNLAGQHAVLQVHLRSAQMFTPAAGRLMGEMLGEMQEKLLGGA